MHSRRSFLRTSVGLVATNLIVNLASAQENKAPPPGVAKAPPKPPALPLDKVQAVVGQSHRSLEAVTRLVEETPLLANASWDWGGGDFETPLQAAAHTGRREIAEFLLSRNARLDLYAAGMLGHFDYVKSVLALNPAAHLIPGPHGFTLQHCAKQGGEKARPLHDWLLANGVPDVAQRPLPFIWPEGTAPAKV